MPPSSSFFSYSRRHPCPTCLETGRRGCECARRSEYDAAQEEVRYQ